MQEAAVDDIRLQRGSKAEHNQRYTFERGNLLVDNMQFVIDKLHGLPLSLTPNEVVTDAVRNSLTHQKFITSSLKTVIT
jgi:hypothetical protein